jgi:hypothetical protein
VDGYRTILIHHMPEASQSLTKRGGHDY